MAQAQKRAKDAEVQAEREREAASRCLSAQKMLKGPKADEQAEMEKEVARQVGMVKANHEVEMQKMKALWQNKLTAAVESEKSKQTERMATTLKQVRLGAATTLEEWKQKYKNMEADVSALKATNQLTV